MKKFLSLVMALVMTMSLVTIGAGATEYKDLSDKGEIQYEEAVAVLNKLGIITGYEDGSFKPTGALTRGAAAKIIVSMMIGPEAAANLSVTVAPYKDVPVSNTFAGVISYCKTAGYINGYADNTFRPTGALTGYAFAKMLLGALGYDGKVEKFTGSGWTMNVANLGGKAGLYNDFATTFKGNAGLTRQDACLLALNTLKATNVSYGNNGGTVTTPDGTVVNLSGSKYEYVQSNNAQINRNIKVGVEGNSAAYFTLEFGEEHFHDLKLDNVRTNSIITDSYGRPSNQWSFKNVKIGTYPITADYMYTKSASGDKDADKVKDMGLGDYKFDANSKMTVNGKDVKVSVGNTTSDANAKALVNQVKNGAKVEVYLSATTANLITHVAVVQTQIMQINRVTSGDVTLNPVEDWGINATKQVVNAVDDSDTLYASLKDLKADDYVVITPLWNGSTYDVDGVFIPTTATGSISKVKVNSVNNDTSGITIGGTDYSMSRNWTADDAGGKAPTNALNTTSVSSKQQSTAYLDSYGYAIYVGNVKATTNYFMYDEAYSNVVDGRIHHFAQGWDTKGNAVSLDLGTSSAALTNLTAGKVVNYTSENTGNSAEYRINWDKTNSNVKTGAVLTAWDANKVSMTANHFFTSGVKYIFATVHDNDGTLETVTVKDGAQKVSVGVPYSYVLNDDKNTAGVWTPKVTAVFLGNDNDVEVSQNVLYVQKQTYATESNGKTTSIFTGYINGEKKTDLVANKKVNDNSFYTYKVDDATGVYTLGSYSTDTGKTTSVVKDAVLTSSGIKNNAYIMSGNITYALGGTNKTVGKDLNLNGATIIDLTSGGTLSSAKDMADAMNTNTTYGVSLMYNDSTNSSQLGRVSYLFINSYNPGGGNGGGGAKPGSGAVGTYDINAAVNGAGNTVISLSNFVKEGFVPASATLTVTADILINGIFAGKLNANNDMPATDTSARFIVGGNITGAVSGDAVTLENLKIVTDEVAIRYFVGTTEVTTDAAVITAGAGTLTKMTVGTGAKLKVELVSSNATGKVRYLVTDNGTKVAENTAGETMSSNVLTTTETITATGKGYIDVTLDKSLITESFTVTPSGAKLLKDFGTTTAAGETITITGTPATVPGGSLTVLKANISAFPASVKGYFVTVTPENGVAISAFVSAAGSAQVLGTYKVTGDIDLTKAAIAVVEVATLAVKGNTGKAAVTTNGFVYTIEFNRDIVLKDDAVVSDFTNNNDTPAVCLAFSVSGNKLILTFDAAITDTKKIAIAASKVLDASYATNALAVTNLTLNSGDWTVS